jgi:ribonucleoside-diphosphate reductase alpha chain
MQNLLTTAAATALSTTPAAASPLRAVSATANALGAAAAFAGYQIIRRNGAVVSFEPNKIAVALMKAFLAVHGTQGAASASVRETVERLTEGVVRAAAPSTSKTCKTTSNWP